MLLSTTTTPDAMTAPAIGVVVAHTPQLSAISAISPNANASRLRSAGSRRLSRSGLMIVQPLPDERCAVPVAAWPAGNGLFAWSFGLPEGRVSASDKSVLGEERYGAVVQEGEGRGNTAAAQAIQRSR